MMIKVIAAIIWQREKILICRRGEGGDCAFLWEFPGGKLEPGESAENCLARECKEELDVIIKVRDVYANFKYEYPDREIEFTFFNAEICEGEVKALVHKEIRWVLPCELMNYEFCPADIEIVHRIYEGK